MLALSLAVLYRNCENMLSSGSAAVAQVIAEYQGA